MSMSKAGYLLPDVIDPGDYKCVVVRVPNDANHIRAFWGHYFELARWWNWERDDAHRGTLAAQVWRRSWDESLDLWIESGGECPFDRNNPPSMLESGGGGCIDCDDCEDNDMPLTMLHFGGRDYLAEVCCGQETNLYEVAKINADISPITGDLVVPKSSDVKALATTDGVFTPVPTSNVDCYAQAAVPYLLGRAADYIESMENLARVGIDAATQYDEALDVLAVVADFLGTETLDLLEIFRGYDIDDVRAAMTGSITEQAMLDAWTYDGPVNRLRLIQWAWHAPLSVNGVPVKIPLMYWAVNSLIPGYNDRLRVLAEECITGQTLDDVNAATAAALGYQDVTVNGTTYRVWTFEPESSIVPGGEWLVPDGTTDGYTNKAIAAEWTLTQSGNMMLYLDPVSKYRLFEAIPSGMMTYRATNVSSDAMTAILQVSGETFTTVTASDGSTNGKVGAVAHSIAQPATLHRLWLAGVAS